MDKTAQIMFDKGMPYELDSVAQLALALPGPYRPIGERQAMVVATTDDYRVFIGYHDFIPATNLAATLHRMRKVKVIHAIIV